MNKLFSKKKYFDFFIFRPYTRTFIYLILNSAYENRKQAYDIIRRLVNNLRSSETDISLAILNSLNSYLEHFDPSITTEENNQQKISKNFEELILCLAKSMRMQDEQAKVLLSNRSLLVCSSSSNILLTNNKLWLKFLYLIYDKQSKQIDIYLQNNLQSLIDICITNQRLLKVIILEREYGFDLF